MPVEAIELEACPNAGGLTNLHVIRRRDIDVFPAVDADGMSISTAIVPKAGCKFVPWDFATDTGEVTHKRNGDVGNQGVSMKAATYVPRGDAKTDAVIQAALNGDFLVAVRDSNGNTRLAGDEFQGVKFEHDY